MLSLRNTITSINGRNRFSTSAASTLVADYVTRVTADGGTVEGTACLQAAIFNLGVRTTFDYIDLVFERWTLDGATIEGTSCFTNSYFLLNTQL